MKITIAGLPGAGKGKLRENLEKAYGIKSFSVGDLRREFARQKEMTIQELNELGEKDSSTDIEADESQKQWAQKQTNFILEGRLSYHFIPESLRIFLTVDPEVGAQRILDAKRDSETTTPSVKKQQEVNHQRCQSDIKRYSQIYGIDSCYKKDNFDIIIDTTNKTPEETTRLVKKKIIDYNQKMSPPTFYLAHPTESKDKIRAWQLGFEKRTGIKLINPFFDCNSLETEMGHLGKEKYLSMDDEQRAALFRGDVEGMAAKNVLGAIFIFDNSYTLGTPIELALTKMMGKLTYTLALHTEKAYHNHPTFSLFCDKVFTTTEELEKFFINNKNEFFRNIEISRKRSIKDQTLQQIYKEIGLNHSLRTD